MFNVFYWPAYAMSINMIRSSKYKDRVDLLLNDIHAFYEIVDEKTELTAIVVKKHMGKMRPGASLCVLAYILLVKIIWKF